MPVLRFLLWRAMQVIPVIFMATLAIFGLVQLVPGDPAATIAGEYATAENIEAIRQSLGLDRPAWEQYGTWLWNAVHGDLSNSLLTGLPVLDEVMRRLPSTLLIAVLALVIAMFRKNGPYRQQTHDTSSSPASHAHLDGVDAGQTAAR